VPLTPLGEVQQLVLDACPVLEPQRLPLGEALGHVLAEEVVAAEDVPRFANAAMDGFAVRAADTAGGGAQLAVVGTVAAGAWSDRPVGAGEAVRIMTGAPVPPGADAIVMVELTQVSDGGSTVVLQAEAAAGDHLRPPGSDLRGGTRVCEAGTVLGPGHVGVLASIGVDRVLVHPRPRVGVFSTGDELVPPSVQPGTGQIRDANRPALLACLVRDGFEPVDLGILPDREDAVRAGLSEAFEGCDALLTSGGVSAGDFDYVKLVLGELAADGGFSRSLGVAIRPAKPFAFAVVPAAAPGGGGARRVPVLGLPGNPVSSLVSYEVLARPAFRKMAGHPDPLRRPVRGVAGEDLLRGIDGKLHLDRVAVHVGADGRLVAHPSGERPQGSHHLGAMAGANALALLPDGDGVREGGELDLLVLDWP
jgi:molybdenum cofactor synthesis domain-containing protein